MKTKKKPPKKINPMDIMDVYEKEEYYDQLVDDYEDYLREKKLRHKRKHNEDNSDA